MLADKFVNCNVPSSTQSAQDGDSSVHVSCVINGSELLVAENSDDATISKWGVGGINRGNRNSFCPIHLAVMNGHVVSSVS